MHATTADIARLQKQVARLQVLTTAACLSLAAVGVMGFTSAGKVEDEVRARRVVVVDDKGVERIVLGQDAQPRLHGRSAAVWIYDQTGAERGGFGTFENGQASFALDAPEGVGSSTTRDRVGLRVTKTGEASIMVLNNDTGVPVRMIADGDAGGGLEFLECRKDEGVVRIKRLGVNGETTRDVRHACGK